MPLGLFFCNSAVRRICANQYRTTSNQTPVTNYSPLFSRRERTQHTITVAHMVHSHTDGDSHGSSTFILLPDGLVGLHKLLLVYLSSHAGWIVHGHGPGVRSGQSLVCFPFFSYFQPLFGSAFLTTGLFVQSHSLQAVCVSMCVCMSKCVSEYSPTVLALIPDHQYHSPPQA